VYFTIADAKINAVQNGFESVIRLDGRMQVLNL
jgi:hypothetical protein